MPRDKASTILFNEMSIVDIFTRLIFDAECKLSDRELLIIDWLVQLEPALATASRRDISEYLRAMGVDEMIDTVGSIKQLIDQQQGLIIANHTEIPFHFRR